MRTLDQSTKLLLTLALLALACSEKGELGQAPVQAIQQAQVETIPPEGGTVQGVTSGTSAAAGACSPGTANAPERVYAWTPSVSGLATVQTCGGNTKFDTVLYAATSADGSGQVACADDATGCPLDSGDGDMESWGSRITMQVEAGHTYYLFVDGWETSQGQFGLTVIPPHGTGVAVATAGYKGQVCVQGNGCMAETKVFALSPGTYAMGGTYTSDVAGSPSLGTFTIAGDGAVTLNAPLNQVFTQSGAKNEVLTANVQNVRVDFGNYPAPVAVNGLPFIWPAYEGGQYANEATLLVGRRYSVWPIYTVDINGVAGGISSDGSGFGLHIGTDGEVTADEALSRTMPASGTTLTLQSRQVMVDMSGGYQGVLNVGHYNPSVYSGHQTAQLLVGRRHSFWAQYAYALEDMGGKFGGEYGVGITEDGNSVYLSDGARASFSASGLTITPRLAAATIDRNTYTGTLCPYAACPLNNPVMLIAGRRYDLGGGHLVTVPAEGACTPDSVDMGGGQSVLVTCNVDAFVAGPPMANAGPDRTVTSGETATLQGSGTTDPPGKPLAYSWTQVSGPTVWLTGGTTAQPTFVAPSVSRGTTLVFSLVVTSGGMASAADQVSVTVFPAGGHEVTDEGTPIAKVMAPGGGGNHNIEVIRDGDKPPVGSGDYSRQYDTYLGEGGATEDWIGYEYSSARSFFRVLFQEGGNFDNGGWFEGLTVQVRRAGNWTAVTNLAVTPAYPGNDHGSGFETYQLDFDSIAGDAIRIYGVPGGSARFISVAELQVFGYPVPTVQAGPDQIAGSGDFVTVNASGSGAAGETVTIRWAQVAGPAVYLESGFGDVNTFVAPAVSSVTDLVFEVVATTGLVDSPPARLEVQVFPMPGARDITSTGSVIAKVTQPTGGGSHELGEIRDGYKPAVGASEFTRQYDTYTGDASRTEDWIGYDYGTDTTFSRVVFQEGGNFDNGGWFQNLTVQVRQGAAWIPVSNLAVSPNYPGDNHGPGFETFTMDFTPIVGSAIRLYGMPGGSMRFISVAELQVIGGVATPDSQCARTFCTLDGRCAPFLYAQGTRCSDGDGCTDQDVCDGAGHCVAGAPASACDVTGCPTDGAHACGQATISVDAVAFGPGDLRVTSNVNFVADHLAQHIVQRLALRTNGTAMSGVEYEVTSPSIPYEVRFRVSDDGKIQVAETDFIKGNGTDTLMLLNPIAAPNIEWEMEERFGERDIVEVAPEHLVPHTLPKPVNPTSWKVYIDLCNSRPFGQTPVERYSWSIARDGVVLDSALNAVNLCRFPVQVPSLGQYTVKATAFDATGQRSSEASKDIELKDYLVVSMGDSYAAGEGNPSVNSTELALEGRAVTPANLWYYPNKHLSAHSGHARAALMLERSDPHSSVTFISVAQSGAEIPHLVDQRQAPGYFPSDSNPQIQDVLTAVCGNDPACANSRKIDYLIVGVGGNDIGFADIVKVCGFPEAIAGVPISEPLAGLPSCNLLRATRFDPSSNSTDKQYCAADNPTDCPVLGPDWTPWDGLKLQVAALIRALREQGYPGLDAKLREKLPLSPQVKILLPEYPNPLIATEGGQLCSTLDFHNAVCGDSRRPDICPNGHIDRDEVAWAHRGVLGPLNETIRSTAALGWTPVGGIVEDNAGYAYCDPSSFTNTFDQTFRIQNDLFGAMHPNQAGQEVIGRHIALEMGVAAPTFVQRPQILSASDEDPPAVCAPGSVVVGAGCEGDYCDVVDIMCKPAPSGVLLGGPQPTRAISEETNGTFVTCREDAVTSPGCHAESGASCGDDSVMVGVHCAGDYCDTVSLQCSRLTTGHLENCHWTGVVSDESHWDVFNPGDVAIGVRCQGSYCDNMNYFVCSLKR